MDHNSIVDEAIINDEKDLNIATRGIRFANFLIDYIAIILLVFGTGSFLFSEEQLTDTLFSNVIGFAYYFGYYFIFEPLTKGKTLGKYITGTRAIKEDGEAATTWDFFRRSLSRLIPFEQFSMFGDHAWHDSIPDMVVIKE